jgi:hypothetical protein
MLCLSAMLSFLMLFSLKLPPAAPCRKLLACRTVIPSGGERGGDLENIFKIYRYTLVQWFFNLFLYAEPLGRIKIFAEPLKQGFPTFSQPRTTK